MVYYYIASSHPSSSTLSSVSGNFISSTEISLIVARNHRVELFRYGQQSLIPVAQELVNGRITCIQRLKVQTEALDWLVVLTVSQKLAIVRFDQEEEKFQTVYHGDVCDYAFRPTDSGPKILCHHSVIMIHLSPGYIKIIPIPTNPSIERSMNMNWALENEQESNLVSFNTRIEELNVVDLALISTSQALELVVLFQDYKFKRHVKWYLINVEAKEFLHKELPHSSHVPSSQHAREGMAANPNQGLQVALSDDTSHLLLPFQEKGWIAVMGHEEIVLLSNHAGISLQRIPSLTRNDIEAYVLRNYQSYLLADQEGLLFQLDASDHGDEVFPVMNMSQVGKVCNPTSLVEVSKDVYFVGSHFEDSQLIQLLPFGESKETISLLETYVNIAPIMDFCVVTEENQVKRRQEQGYVVTCSGGKNCGSLRIIRLGVGLTPRLSVDVPGIKNLWTLSSDCSDTYQELIIASLHADATMILRLGEDQELEEVESGWATTAVTLYAGVMRNSCILQVTSSQVILLNAATLDRIQTWQGERTILQAIASHARVLLSLSGGMVVCLELNPSQRLEERGRITLPHEVACLDLFTTEMAEEDFAVVATWMDHYVRLYRLPNFEPVLEEYLKTEVIPRSVLVAQFAEQVCFLLVALGDGDLISYSLYLGGAQVELSQRKQITLGTRPANFRRINIRGISCVATTGSDQPAMIYCSRGKLIFSSLNEKDVTSIRPFRTSNHANGLVWSTPEGLQFGEAEDLKQIQVKTVPIADGDIPRRIQYLPKARVFAVATISADNGGNLRIYEEKSFQEIQTLNMPANELICSLTLISSNFEGGDERLILGTALNDEEAEEECTKGTIIGINLSSNDDGIIKAGKKWQHSVDGAVFSLCKFDENKFVAGINGQVHLFQWSDDDQPTLLCKYRGETAALCLSCMDGTILVGDLMRSAYLLIYQDEEKQELVRKARDMRTRWTHALTLLNKNTVLSADMFGNLYVLSNDEEGDDDRFIVESQWHLSAQVNRFHKGSMSRIMDDTAGQPILWVTACGGVGVILSLSDHDYLLLHRLQQHLAEKIPSFGHFSHAAFRDFQDEREQQKAIGVIDGDFVEQFLSLDAESQKQIFAVNSTPEELEEDCDVSQAVTLLETLQRMH